MDFQSLRLLMISDRTVRRFKEFPLLKWDADFKYYRAPDGTHHVPKRQLAELILKKKIN